MCTPTEAWMKFLNWIDKHPITFTMIAGFLAGGLACWYIGHLTQSNQEKMLEIMEKQSISQVEIAKALHELAIRQQETNSRLTVLEAEIHRPH